MNYSEWLLAQSVERQDASIDQMLTCIALGVVQRTGDRVAEARLLAIVRDYHARWDAVDAIAKP